MARADFVERFLFVEFCLKYCRFLDPRLKSIEEMSLDADPRILICEIMELKLENKDKKITDGVYYFNCLSKLIELFEERSKSNLDPIDIADPDLVYLQWLSYLMDNKVMVTQNIFNAHKGNN